MSLSALIFITIFALGVVLTLKDPFYGVALYIFEWHNSPGHLWWGDELPDLRWSYTIAILILISIVINYKKLPPLEKPDFKPLIWLVLLVINIYIVSFAFAILPEESMAKAVDWSKRVIFYTFVILLVRRFKDYRFMIWVLILGVANFGKIAYEVGKNRYIGVTAPNATEENAVAAHVVAVLPFYMWYFFKGNRWSKIVILIATPFVLNLLILANSRGAFLAAAAIGLFAILWTKGTIRLSLIGGLVLAALAFLYLTNDQFWQRQETTFEHKDNSAMSRIYIWKGAFKILAEYPFGLGGEVFDDMIMNYAPELNAPKTQHNTFIAIATDWGILGIFLYLGFLIHSFLLTVKIKRLALKIPALSKYYFEAIALQLGLIGISVAGMTQSRQYAEIVYWICAFIVALYNIQKTELARLQRVEVREKAPEPVVESAVFS